VLKAGDRITAKFFPARSGTPIGYLKSLTAADGTTFELPANPFNPVLRGQGAAASPPIDNDRR
jgi:hypothetical protein